MSAPEDHTNRAGALLAAVALVSLLVSVPDRAGADEHRWFTSTGGEAWAGVETGGHGFLLAHWRWEPDGSPFRLDAEFDTDTLRVGLSRIDLGPQTRLYGQLAGEYPFAGLLPDYYRLGRRIPGRGFRAGYVAVKGGVELHASETHFLQFEATGRRWLFRRTDATDDRLRLPPEASVVEPRIRYTFWQLEDDPSHWEPHRPFWRILGVAGGLAFGADLRSETRRWGAFDPSFEPPDPRNDPARAIPMFRQWFAAGWRLARPLRFQFHERIRWGIGDDDLSRDRIGGLNPYSVPVAGLPWAGLISGKYAAIHAGLRVELPGDHELGPFVDAAAVADARRIGDLDTFSHSTGAGVLADLRFGDWNVDLRAGSALPARWLLARPDLGAWLSVGRRWD